MPFFSIIIPTLNRKDKLLQTLMCLEQQQFIDFEVVIVEDGNNNGEAFTNGFPNLPIVYNHLTDAKNVSEKRNIGVKLSTGEYLLFLDDDDEVTESWLQDFFISLNESKSDIAFCAADIIRDGIKEKTIFPECAYTDERKWGIFLAGAFAVKKQTFIKIGGYDEVLKYGENTELGFRIKQQLTSKVFINNPNLKYKASTNGGSKSVMNTYTANKHIIKKHSDFFKSSPVLHFNYLSVLGVASIKLKLFDDARSFFKTACNIRPTKPQAIFRLVVSYVPFIAIKIWRL